MSHVRAGVLQRRGKKGRSGVRLNPKSSRPHWGVAATLGKACPFLPYRLSLSVSHLCRAISVDIRAGPGRGWSLLGADTGADAWRVGGPCDAERRGREFQAQRRFQHVLLSGKHKGNLTQCLLSRNWQFRLFLKPVSLIHCHFLPSWNWSPQ